MTTTPDPQFSDDALSASIGKITDILGEIKDLRQDQEDFKEDQRLKERKFTRWLKTGTGVIIFDFLVAIAGVTFIILGISLAVQLKNSNERLEHYIKTDCVLYGFIINSYNPNSPNRAMQGPLQYDKFYIEMQKATDERGCGIRHKVPGT